MALQTNTTDVEFCRSGSSLTAVKRERIFTLLTRADPDVVSCGMSVDARTHLHCMLTQTVWANI